MIAIDTSALVAIALREPEREAFSRVISDHSCVVGVPTLVETRMVLHARLPGTADAFIDGPIRHGVIFPEPFTLDMYAAARDAFARYGRGTGHPARLNFGDCLSYAVAKVRGIPLLYKGQDFAKTDIRAAL